jgi:hypothetical protein
MTEQPQTVDELEAALAAAKAKAAEEPGPGPDPIPVAEQRAAGVPPEETVTIAEQKAGADPPAAVLPDPPEEQISVGMREGGGTSNESPALPANAVTGAARAHALLSHAQDALAAGDHGRLAALIQMVKDELDRYLPDQVKAAGIPEARQMVAEQL